MSIVSPVNTPAALPRRIYNFSAGPAALPEAVLHQAREDLWSVFGTGIGVLEHSHRGAVIDRVLHEAIEDCRTLAGVGDDHEILFLPAGATLQFAMIPMNFLPADGVADYLDTGVWAHKSVVEAKRFGTINVAFDGSRTNYDHLPAPRELTLTDGAAYLAYCANNTVFATQFTAPPATASPLVCDASSDIFSRPWDIAGHALVYASAQKNLGPAGITLSIVRRDFLDAARPAQAERLPGMLDYRCHARAGSRLNTPPTFGMYMIGRVLRWIIDEGGVEEMARRAEARSRLLYEAIDSSGGFYRGLARADSRSTMNVSFRTPSPELDDRFVAEAAAEGLDGLRGHREAGGLRASIYNPCPIAACEALASFMREFARRAG